MFSKTSGNGGKMCRDGILGLNSVSENFVKWFFKLYADFRDVFVELFQFKSDCVNYLVALKV